VLFAFGALLNAFAMVSPVYAAEQWLAGVMGVSSEAPVLGVVFLVALGIVPLMMLTAAAFVSRLLARSRGASIPDGIVLYAVALIPLGFGMWIAHYAFHLWTGALTIVPVTQSAAIDLFGWAALGDPRWGWTGARPGAIFPIQLGFVLLGTVGSIAVAHGISEREHPARPTAATVPWAVVVLLVGAAALWVLSNPMEMRGVGFSG
jgi:hypothetical protein